MGYWKRTTLVKKRYETVVGHNNTINLRNFTDNVAWEDERVLLNWNNFNLRGYAGTNTINYYGLAIAVANPIGNNIYNTQVGVVRVNINTNTQGTNHGLIVNSGIQFNSNVNYTVFSGTYYAFFFMVAFNNKLNGLINGSGFEVYANNNLIARHFVSKDYNFLNNFVVARFTDTAGWTGNIEIRPVGNRNFKVGYENAVIHNLFIYTQPVTFYGNTASLIAIEGDI